MARFSRRHGIARYCFAGAALAFAGCRATPMPDGTASATTRLQALADTTWPAGPIGASARRGHALLAHTPDSLPRYAASALRCLSCHLDDGTRKNGLMLAGAFARFPQYRARSGRVDLLSDRINDCFRRSLNGRALPTDGAEMHDIITYFAWISRGVGVFDSLSGQGLPKMTPLAGDTARGAFLFASTCARCHGAGGAGMPGDAAGVALGLVPPLWGDRSFNIGAGMARLRTAAAFIRYNMPLDFPGSLTDQQAFDIASYVVSRPRPDFVGKELDWPKGDPPPDAAYPTAGAKARAAAVARSTPTSAR